MDNSNGDLSLREKVMKNHLNSWHFVQYFYFFYFEINLNGIVQR